MVRPALGHVLKPNITDMTHTSTCIHTSSFLLAANTQAAVRQDMEALSRAEQQLVQAQEAEIEALEEWDAWYADSNRARIPQPPKPDGLQVG